MSIVLSAYSVQAYKEFVLPAVDNTETSLLLERKVFHTHEDVTLELEVLDGQWYFRDPEQRLTFQNAPYDRQTLRHGDSYQLRTEENELLVLFVSVRESFFSVCPKYDLSKLNQIVVGAAPKSHIAYSFLLDGENIVSQEHMVLTKTEGGWLLEDRSVNGIFCNDQRVGGKLLLNFGDCINIWGLKLVYLGNALAVDVHGGVKVDESLPLCQESARPPIQMEQGRPQPDKEYYHRPPRNMEKLADAPVEIEAPPPLQQYNSPPLLMMIGPSLTMAIPMMAGTTVAILASRSSGYSSGIYMYTGIITALLSAVIGVFWALINVRYNRRQQKLREEKRLQAYGDYLDRKAGEIQQRFFSNHRILNERYPEASAVVGAPGQIPPNLWSRNRTHEDFLSHRLGLGDLPFQVSIEIPKERFTIDADELRDKPSEMKKSYEVLHDVPVLVNLDQNALVGVVGGPEKEGAYPVVYGLIAQIATQNCYTDVKLAFLTGQEQSSAARWQFARWLPHTWSQDKKMRYVALERSETSDVCYELTQVLRQRAEARSSAGANRQRFYPHYVLIVEDESLLEGELITRYLYEQGGDLGITTILMAESYGDLPNACECVIEYDGEYQGIYNVKTGKNEGQRVQFDSMNEAILEDLARRLANVEVNETETGGEIPPSVTFFDLYGIQRPEDLNVSERWKKNRTYDNMRALIGRKAGGQECYLDIHEKYHGPHGIVAGTTGSGKSETLQTYLISLALNFSPYDVGFFIIDYKGGGMGNLFTNLPHVLGQISNLSGNQVQRAMVSIKSENLRRQRIFNENGVNNINAYTRLYKSGEATVPVPHLLIIIDEFAELNKAQPEFMLELISVSQVGRSLGVHLILATQKPNNTVDDNIRSNSKFRLCLRVQDRQDSMDMLHKPDAAYITQAGRGYLQVGNDELYELFQSGWSGAPYDDTVGNEKQTIAVMLTNTGRTSVVGNYLKSKRLYEAKARWIQSLIQLVQGALNSEDGREPVDRVWEMLEAAGVDYPQSEYNDKLLRNLIDLYETIRTPEGEVEDAGAVARTLIELAQGKNLKLPELREKTQLDAVVELLQKTAVQEGYDKLPPLWLPVLGRRILLESLEGYGEERMTADGWPKLGRRWELKAMAGLCDDPVNQYQMPLELNFTQDGNHAVLGAAMSGKSTFLQTVIFSLMEHYSPEYVNFYILDFSSRMLEPFEKAPHVGGVLYESDVETVGKFFNMLQRMLEERKKRFKGGNYEQYVLKNGVVCPAVVVVLDNVSLFRQRTGEQYDSFLMQFARECTANGIYLLLSGGGFGISDIPSKLGDSVKRTVSLEMQDRYAYGEALRMMSVQTYPESGIPGRGLVVVDEAALEFQTCLSVEAEDDYTRNETLRERVAAMRAAWSGPLPRAIPHIPEKPVWSEFRALYDTQQLLQDPASLPIGYDAQSADVVGVDLSQTYCYLISGKAKSGKTNLLRIMARAACEKGGQVTFVELENEELQTEADSLHAAYLHDVSAYKEFLLNELVPIFQERMKEKRAYKQQGLSDDEIFDRMKTKPPYFILISDLTAFTVAMHEGEGRTLNCYGATTNLLEKGSGVNVYFVAAFNWDNRTNALGKSVYETFLKYQTGVHLGGGADSQSALKFEGANYKELARPDKPGCGFMTPTENTPSLRVITPFARG